MSLEQKVISFSAVIAVRRCIAELDRDERKYVLRILKQLQQNDRPNFSAVARKLGIPQPRFHERVAVILLKLRRALENDPESRPWLEDRGLLRPRD